MQVIHTRGCGRPQTDHGGVLHSRAADERYAVGTPKYLSSKLPGQMHLTAHLLFSYREIRRLENLTDFDRVTGFGRATLRPFHDFFF